MARRDQVGRLPRNLARDHRSGEVAVRAFLEAATLLKSVERWPIFVERLERALQVTAILGRGKELHLEALSLLEATITEFAGNAAAACARC